jgi:hypothetical protein
MIPLFSRFSSNNPFGRSLGIAAISELGALVVVLALVVAWKWNPDTLK